MDSSAVTTLVLFRMLLSTHTPMELSWQKNLVKNQLCPQYNKQIINCFWTNLFFLWFAIRRHPVVQNENCSWKINRFCQPSDVTFLFLVPSESGQLQLLIKVFFKLTLIKKVMWDIILIFINTNIPPKTIQKTIRQIYFLFLQQIYKPSNVKWFNHYFFFKEQKTFLVWIW